jgi:hypothetical protein
MVKNNFIQLRVRVTLQVGLITSGDSFIKTLVMVLECMTKPAGRAGHSLIYSGFALSAHRSTFSHGSLTLNRSFSGFQVSLVAQTLIAQPVVL